MRWLRGRSYEDGDDGDTGATSGAGTGVTDGEVARHCSLRTTMVSGVGPEAGRGRSTVRGRTGWGSSSGGESGSRAAARAVWSSCAAEADSRGRIAVASDTVMIECGTITASITLE